MYRIELKPGEVTVFRTIEELATGVRNGVISPKARIYHNASEKWLPIEFHPHYKQALDLLAGRTSELPTPKPVERPLSFLAPAPKPAEPPRTDTRSLAPAPKPAEAPRADTRSFLAPAPKPAEAPRADTRSFLAPAPKPAEPPRTDPLSFLSPTPTPAVTTLSHAPDPVTPSAEAQVALAPVITTPVLIEEEPIEEEPIEEEPVEEEVVEEEPAEVLVNMPFAALPRVSASPVLDLPTITYPEITPLEQPVAVQASSASRGRRSLHLAGAVLVLALGGYASLSLLSAFTGAATIADRPTVPASSPVTPAPSATKPTPSPKPGTTRAPLAASVGAASPASAQVPPASSGFARALEARAIVNTPANTGDLKPTGAATDSATIEPPPIDLDVAAPTLPGAESLTSAPRAQSDSAMKKILRAVNGGKDTPQKP